MSNALKRQLAADLDGSYADLVRDYGPTALAIGRRLGDPASAEDVLQETFTKAYRTLANQTATQIKALDLRPWLVTIALNTVRNEQRRRSRKPTQPLPADVEKPRESDTSSTLSSSIDTESAAVANVSLDELTQLLDILPLGHREVVTLRHIAGLTTKETAAVLDVPVGTVKSNLARGLATLRTAINAKELT